MPGPEILEKALKIDGTAVVDHRREWSRQIEREVTP